MINIVKYNLYRLLKNKLIFGLMLVGIIAGGGGTAISQHFGAGMFDFSILIITVVLPSIIYTDYKDGLIRNKSMAGNSRFGIYAANLISNSVIGVVYWLIYQGISIGLMNILPGTPLLTGTHAAVYLLIGSIAVVSLCAIYTVIAVNVRSHYSLIICIAVYVVMTMLCSSFINLTAKPSINDALRQVLLILYRVIPAGQFTLLETHMFEAVWLLPLLSVVLITIMTVLGTALFAKKDLK